MQFCPRTGSRGSVDPQRIRLRVASDNTVVVENADDPQNWAVPDFLSAAGAAGAVLEVPSLARDWLGPSVLEGFTVGELAGHFIRAVAVTNAVVARGEADAPPVDLIDYYAAATSTWRSKASEIQANAAAEGAPGPQVLTQRWLTGLAESRRLLTEQPPSTVRTSAGAVLTLND